MNNWTAAEIAFRCDRLSLRMERLAQNFLRMGSMSLDGVDAETVRAIVKESKVFIELTAIDLDIESAFELAQIQRQLSRWDVHWLETWESDTSRIEISTLSQVWANRIREIAGVFV
jgi:3-hydroxyacyl-CoA dehydrogenase